jgi:DegV family protein with EDD domain
MSRVRIVTDSTSCLPSDLVSEFGIGVVPVGLVIEGKVHRDGEDITLAEICERFETMQKQPTTSAVSPGDFINVFTDFAESADTIVCILVSRILTATQESAYLARKHMRKLNPGLRIEMMDSKTSAGALGFIVLAAARAAATGASAEEVMETVRDMTSRVIYLAALDTLKYLINMGRAPRAGNIGEMLNVKPIIGFTDDTGLTEVVARVRGRRSSLERMVDLVERHADTTEPLHVMVHYCNGNGDAEQLREMIASRYQCAEILTTPFTPAMVGATGPMVGLSFYS